MEFMNWARYLENTGGGLTTSPAQVSVPNLFVPESSLLTSFISNIYLLFRYL